MSDPKIFKDYDIRGTVPDQLNPEIASKIGYATAEHFKVKEIAVGRDMRLASPELFDAFVSALTDSGVDVFDLGMVSSDMLWFASGKYNFPLSVSVTASHNPPEWDGFKMALSGAQAVSGDSGLYAIRDMVNDPNWQPKPSETKGAIKKREIMDDWVTHALNFVDKDHVKPLKVAVDAGNGMAGPGVKPSFEILGVNLIPLYFELDGSFPNHLADPMKDENTTDLKNKIISESASFGAAFDGDGDRVIFLDEKGNRISGTVTTAMLAKVLLEKNPGSLVLYNAIVGRVVPELVKSLGGESFRVRVGHSLIKQAMREKNGLFCGEHSFHFFYRDNYFADSGLITLLLFLEMVSKDGRPVSEIVSEFDKYPQSGEINFKSEDKEKVLQSIKAGFEDAESKDELDGISVWYKDWWFNVRPSNTENLVRLNIEADNKEILETKIIELTELIERFGAVKA